MKRRWLCLLVALCLIFPMTACSGGGEGSTGSSMRSEELPANAVGEPVPAEPEEDMVPNPLSGLPLDPEKVNNRPVAVMLNDLKAALPQLGVSKADIIYEVPAEGGITRMLALFQDLEGVGDLGSIRSTRTYYLELALGHDASLVHAGGSPEAYDKIPKWGVDHLDGVRGGRDAEVFWRDAERRKRAGLEHSMLTSGENILAYLGSSDLRLTHEGQWENALFLEDGTPQGGDPATQATVRFSNYKTGKFNYDPDRKLYLISQFGEPYMDGETGEQVGVTNVLILKTDVSLVSGDTAGRLSVDIQGDGDGVYLCGGKQVNIRWSKDARNEPFRYVIPGGGRLYLGAGHTYVCIVSSNSEITIQ